MRLSVGLAGDLGRIGCGGADLLPNQLWIISGKWFAVKVIMSASGQKPRMGRPIATNASVCPPAKQVKIGTEMQVLFPALGNSHVVFALFLTNLLSRDMSRPHALA